jgi:hypothetical protein
MTAKITVEEWLSALDGLDKPATDAYTIMAWQEKIGKGRLPTNRWVRTGLEQGWMERAPTIVTSITGGTRRMVGFRLVGKKAKK